MKNEELGELRFGSFSSGQDKASNMCREGMKSRKEQSRNNSPLVYTHIHLDNEHPVAERKENNEESGLGKVPMAGKVLGVAPEKRIPQLT